MKTKKEANITKKTVEKDKSKGMVVLPYVQGFSETTSRIMNKYNVNTDMKPHNTIKRSLVRPKDKVEPQKMCKGVYSITCKEPASKNTLRKHRLAEPTPEATEKTSEKEMHKSAITDHMTEQNPIVDWEGPNM